VAGGDIRGRQSAALIVVTGKPTGRPWADRVFDLRVDESLPLFRRVFAMDSSWATLTPRLPKSGLLPDDPGILERILRQAPAPTGR
jgi:hypothetical protein